MAGEKYVWIKVLSLGHPRFVHHALKKYVSYQMQRMMKKFFPLSFFLLALCLTAVSCQKREPSEPEPVDPQNLQHLYTARINGTYFYSDADDKVNLLKDQNLSRFFLNAPGMYSSLKLCSQDSDEFYTFYIIINDLGEPVIGKTYTLFDIENPKHYCLDDRTSFIVDFRASDGIACSTEGHFVIDSLDRKHMVAHFDLTVCHPDRSPLYQVTEGKINAPLCTSTLTGLE